MATADSTPIYTTFTDATTIHSLWRTLRRRRRCLSAWIPRRNEKRSAIWGISAKGHRRL